MDKTVIFFAEFPWKKRVQFAVKDYWFCFCPKVWTPWPQLKTSYTGLITVWPWCWWPFFFQTGFYRTLREVILTVFFLIICRWNLFRTICANSRKVGLGKFLSPYKDIPVDLSRIPVNKGTNSRLRLTSTVICLKLSTWASSSFLYICSLECNAGKVYY